MNYPNQIFVDYTTNFIVTDISCSICDGKFSAGQVYSINGGEINCIECWTAINEINPCKTKKPKTLKEATKDVLDSVRFGFGLAITL